MFSKINLPQGHPWDILGQHEEPGELKLCCSLYYSIPTYIHTHIHIYTYIYLYCARTHTDTHQSMYIYIYIYIYIFIYNDNKLGYTHNTLHILIYFLSTVSPKDADIPMYTAVTFSNRIIPLEMCPRPLVFQEKDALGSHGSLISRVSIAMGHPNRWMVHVGENPAKQIG